MKDNRGHLDLNQGPLDLQSNALPLSYTPSLELLWFIAINQCAPHPHQHTVIPVIPNEQVGPAEELTSLGS